MPQVPQYDEPQVRQEAMPAVRVQGEGSLEAFGGGQSLERVGEAQSQLASTAYNIADQEKQKADQVSFMAADKQLSDLETQLQVKTSKMLGKDAAGAPDVVQNEWQQGVQNITKGLSNDQQRMAVARSANQRYESLNKNVQVHVAGQLKAYDDNETQSYIETSRNAAVLNANDDDRISSELDRQKAALTDWAKRNGVPVESDIFKNKLTDIQSATHKDVINARLDQGDVDGAKEYFDANKQGMAAGDVVMATKIIDEKQTLSQGMDAYDKVQGMKLGDGQPDEIKMRSAINAMDLSDEKKEKVWDYVKARANEDFLNKNRRDAANERSFMNNVIQARQQGQSMDDALKLVDKFGIDDYDKTVKSAAVASIYAPPKDSDEVAKYNLWQGIQDGSVAQKDIDSAFQNNKLNGKDWAGLKEEYYKAAVEGRAPQMKFTNDRIKELAEQNFGSNKVKQAEFINMVNTEGVNLSPDEKFKKAQDLLQTDKSTQKSFFGLFHYGAQQQFESDLQAHDASSLAFGKANEDLGPETVKAIGQGVLQNKGKFTPGDLDSFSVQMGGYDKIKRGTQGYSAIQWLMKKNMPVVPENVKAVIANGKVSQQ